MGFRLPLGALMFPGCAELVVMTWGWAGGCRGFGWYVVVRVSGLALSGLVFWVA